MIKAEDELMEEALAAFKKFEKATGKSVEGFHFEYAKKGEPFYLLFEKKIVFEFKELEWPFNTNAKPPVKRRYFGGILV